MASVAGIAGALPFGAAAQELEVVGQPLAYKMGFQPAATELARDLQGLDHMLLIIISVIVVFVTGLLIWIPLAITIWVLHLIVTTMDQTLTLLPFEFRPEFEIFGRVVHIPGLGVIATILAVFLTGVFGSNILGQRLITFWENLLGRIPVVKTLYHGVKQVSDTTAVDSRNWIRFTQT